MGWRDFRDFLAELEQRGMVRHVAGADPDLEIGTLVELMCERMGPMLLFDQIKGFPPGYRIAGKPYATPARAAIALGLDDQLPPLALVKAWKAKAAAYRPIPPVTVSSGAVLQNVFEDDAVDLTRVPVPRWHEGDGGLYLGTGCAVITRDPDEGWVNAGAYRCMLHDARTTGIDIAPYHHGNLHFRKWWAQGKSCPIAVAVSPDPALFFTASNGLPWGSSEFDFAGYIRGEPLETVPGLKTGLPIPATAELVFEGEVPPPEVEQRVEGPFGEFTGYYAGGEKLRPIIRVQALYHRTDPILQGDPPLKPPVAHWGGIASGSVQRVWDGLEKSGIPGIVGVYDTLGGEGGLVLTVAIRQQYAGHARQVGRVASALVHAFYHLIVVVDEDIDPSRPEDVLWAISTRADPAAAFEIHPECPSHTLDPTLPPDKRARNEMTTNRAVVIACRPWQWKDQFPPVSRASDALRDETLAKWRSLFA
ncbi:MAG TPA: UbiD family decarboxylase [Chloroflexota bacterium]|nr:UbiD family decarboxylase [Chloroflexota bacterium]